MDIFFQIWIFSSKYIYARNVFVYKDKNGNINKDIKCKNLADLIEPIASAKADELIKEDYYIRMRSFSYYII